jgi:hypothetical protein
VIILFGHGSLAPIDAFIEPPYQALHTNSKHITDSQQRAYGDRAARFDLLPMPSRKSEGDHVLLAVVVALAQLSNSTPQAAKELFLIQHA